MSVVDYAIAAIVLISLVIGIWRGFIREALSVIVWIAAFWLAYSGAETLALKIEGTLDDKALAVLISFVALFLVVHIAGFFISRLLAKAVKSIGLSGVDRVAGAGFGALRGLVIVSVVVLLVGLTPLNQSPQWADSYMVDLVRDVLAWVDQRYPLELEERLAGVMG